MENNQKSLDIKPQYTHSKAGNFLFNMCAKSTKFLCKHRFLYYLLACTWGLIMTVLGFVITLILGIDKLFTKNIKFKKYNWIYKIYVGPDYWGGCEMGLMFLRDQKSSDKHIDDHEFGHTFQNCIFGPLFPFLVAIPSMTRYWARELKPNHPWPAYDAAWFEDAATQCGAYANWYINNKK